MVAKSKSEGLAIKQPYGLSPRIEWLRDYYFRGVDRKWNNEFTCWTTGVPWDVTYNELTFYIVPESYAFFPDFHGSMLQAAREVATPDGFYRWHIAKRRAWLIKEIMVNQVPTEILPGDLIAGGRFNLSASKCWSKKENQQYRKAVLGKKGARAAVKWFHDHGYGNAGATSGHLVPDHARVLEIGWRGIYEELQRRLDRMTWVERSSPKRSQIEAMKIAATMPRDLAERYGQLCEDLAKKEPDTRRRAELERMSANLSRVPWEPPRDFWEALQALWINHMLVMSDENYPGPGISFGRLDQYLYPYWQESLARGEKREYLKEILKCFWIHSNTAYDAMIRVGGNQGITAGYGQLFNLSGLGANGEDLTNDLTYALLEVIDEMSPILEPKPNVRLHRNSPEKLLDKVVEMIASSQGAPFLINFDERSMAGMMREAHMAGVEHLINEKNVHDYVSVGCLENSMAGNDRSGTVDCNLNLLKAVELALTGGKDIVPAVDPITGQQAPITQDGPKTGDSRSFTTWDQFWAAFEKQIRYALQRCVDLYEVTESLRAELGPTPYLSCLVRGCTEKAKDVTQGGAELGFVTIEGVTYATTVDSLLAIKHLVFDTRRCTMEDLIDALRDNWEGHDMLRAWAKHRAPKYGRDDDEADEMAKRVMDLWTAETWKHTTKSTGRQFRPGMLSWNYWVADGAVLAASADGRPRGQFLSNAICPSNGADIKGPTANANSVGKVLGGFDPTGRGDWQDWCNSLPNGASHTMTFDPSLLRDEEHREKFKGLLKGFCRNGGTALQVNVVDVDTLKDAQAHPEHYRHLLVRVTGYNTYFTSIGRELQDEIIARESHQS